MRRTAWAGLAERGFVRVGSEPPDQSVQVVRRNCFICEHHQRTLGGERDGFEIVDHVVGQLVDRSVHHMRGE